MLVLSIFSFSNLCAMSKMMSKVSVQPVNHSSRRDTSVADSRSSRCTLRSTVTRPRGTNDIAREPLLALKGFVGGLMVTACVVSSFFLLSLVVVSAVLREAVLMPCFMAICACCSAEYGVPETGRETNVLVHTILVVLFDVWSINL